jgi:hypothetical protein
MCIYILIGILIGKPSPKMLTSEEISTQWGADETLGMYLQNKLVRQGSVTKGI